MCVCVWDCVNVCTWKCFCVWVTVCCFLPSFLASSSSEGPKSSCLALLASEFGGKFRLCELGQGGGREFSYVNEAIFGARMSVFIMKFMPAEGKGREGSWISHREIIFWNPSSHVTKIGCVCACVKVRSNDTLYWPLCFIREGNIFFVHTNPLICIHNRINGAAVSMLFVFWNVGPCTIICMLILFVIWNLLACVMRIDMVVWSTIDTVVIQNGYVYGCTYSCKCAVLTTSTICVCVCL